MNYFGDKIIKPFCISQNYRRICEIGSRYGKNTDKLLTVPGLTISIVDPCIESDLMEKYRQDPRIKIYADLSLNVLPSLDEPFDAILIDGDHNWYTVYHELKVIEERSLLCENGTIFLHDVIWPYARRDMYYDPDAIPAEFRHPYARAGIKKNISKLVGGGGLNDHLLNAEHEGGPRNGILTAIEDFLSSAANQYSFLKVEVECGLGVITKNQDLDTEVLQREWTASARQGEFGFALRRAIVEYLAWPIRRIKRGLSG